MVPFNVSSPIQVAVSIESTIAGFFREAKKMLGLSGQEDNIAYC